ncbi:hypothetical protein Tco_0543263 [Tanacetum coccineum]
MDDIVSSYDEWEESDYGNPPNTYSNTESLFKPYLDAHEKSNIGKEDERRVCKAEKFEAIKYSLGPNEEYIGIKSCEYNAWERSEDSVSHIYQDIFQKRTRGGP